MKQEVSQIAQDENLVDSPADINGSVHRLDNHVHIQEGMYCRSNIAIDDVCVENDYLLITQLHYADNSLHAVSVLAHPRYNANRYIKKMLHSFDENFVVVPKDVAERAREAEIEAIHARYKNHEEYLTDLQTNHNKRREMALELYSRRITHKPAKEHNEPLTTNNVLELISSGNAKATIQNLSETLKFHTEIKNIELNILSQEATKLKNILSEILPYTEQRMKAVQASAIEGNEHIDKIAEGIASMQLYSGDTVTIETICEGKSAPSDIPLTMVQQRLVGSLEFALQNEKKAVELDVFSEQFLLDELKKNPDFVSQIFPTERSMVLMALRNDFKEYNDSITNYFINESNRKVFILVRNGENIYQVFSPISTHSSATKLFPSKSDLDDIFNKGGVDITIDDLWYSSAFNQREKAILHYKRFLLLVAGLDHHHQLFGSFYPQERMMEIFSPSFQSEFFNFIHDADGEGLIDSGFDFSLREWIELNNRKTVVGSMLLINVDNLINEDDAPACYKYKSRDNSHHKIARPIEQYQLVRLQEDKNGLYVRALVEKCNEWGEILGEPFNTRIAMDGNFSTTNILLLNNVKPDHLQQFIDNRKYRNQIFEFIGIFKEAINIIKTHFKAIEPLYNTIYDSVRVLPNLLPISNESLEMEIMDAINLWSAKNKKHYPDLSLSLQKKALVQICNALYFRVTDRQHKLTKQAVKLLKHDSNELRFTIGFDGTMYLYASIPNALQDNRYEDHAWVDRHTLSIDENGVLSIKNTEPTLLIIHENYEHILKEYDAIQSQHWVSISRKHYKPTRGKYESAPTFFTMQDKQFTLDAVDNGYNLFQSLFKGESISDIFITQIKSELKDLNQLNLNAVLSLPIGIIDKKIAVMVVKNHNEVLTAIQQKKSYIAEIYLSYISLYQYVSQGLQFVTMDTLINVQQTPNSVKFDSNLFGPAIKESFHKNDFNLYYTPFPIEYFYSKLDFLVFDKYVKNPHYNENVKIENILIACPDNSGYKNDSIIPPNKYSLLFLVGKEVTLDILKAIINDLGREKSYSGCISYNLIENVQAPTHTEKTILYYITTTAKSNYMDSLAISCYRSQIKTIEKLKATEIEINIEKYKEYKLYCVLDELS